MNTLRLLPSNNWLFKRAGNGFFDEKIRYKNRLFEIRRDGFYIGISMAYSRAAVVPAEQKR